jgi:hypothetical protein
LCSVPSHAPLPSLVDSLVLQRHVLKHFANQTVAFRAVSQASFIAGVLIGQLRFRAWMLADGQVP